MGTGQIQTVLICVPAELSQAPCPAGMGVSTTMAYVINPDRAASIEAQYAEFDYGHAAAIWTMAFTFVVGLYLVSKSAGTVMNAIRNL